MKQNKIKGGVYKGVWWRDFIDETEAKKVAHKQERQRAKAEIRKEV